MFDPIQGPSRAALRVAAREPGTLRERLDREDLAALEQGPAAAAAAGTGTVVVDDRRRRPLYFDGRFLAARDLTREQNYFLTRQADLGRAGGSGVVHGLMVRPGSSASTIRIEPGHGATPSGELVVLSEALEINLADVTLGQRLDAAFGLAAIPALPQRSRSGLFVVALRPVEFAANLIASYPTSLTGPRSAEYGDIVEAAAVTLYPYEDQGGRVELDQRRARVARELFVLSRGRGLAAEALPLALVALDRGVVRWVDPFMVRREVGGQHGDVLSLTSVSRAQREAYLLQYDAHLQDILRQRQASQHGWRFAATEHFQALPPVGRMPAAAIAPADFSQIFFPPEVETELSFVAEDELGALVEEGLLLAPIDLTLSGDDLESTDVLVLIPMPRHRLRALRNVTGSLTRPLPSSTPRLLAKARPIELLRLRLPPRLPVVPQPDAGELADQAWREALAAKDLLWYVRRRNLSYRAELAGAAVIVGRDELSIERELGDRLRGLGLLTRYRRLRETATADGVRILAATLASPKVSASPLLAEAAISALESQPQLDSVSATRAVELFNDPAFGAGILRVETLRPKLKEGETVKSLLAAGVLGDLDRLGSVVVETDHLAQATDAVVAVAIGDAPDKAEKLVAVHAMTEALGKQAVLGSTVLTTAALARLSEVHKVDAVASASTAEALTDPRFGAGLILAEREQPALADAQVVKALLEAGALRDLDKLAAASGDREAVKAVAAKVVALAKGDAPDRAVQIKALVTGSLKLLPR